jgi:predicted enzyme related to lactoylglutathione lyase
MDFAGVLIGSEDPRRLSEFYTRMFGEPSMEMSGYTGWNMSGAWITVGPHDEVKGQNAEPGRVIWNLVTQEVKAEFERMRDAGATVVREPYDPGGGGNYLVATLADPDGNYFQLAKIGRAHV